MHALQSLVSNRTRRLTALLAVALVVVLAGCGGGGGGADTTTQPDAPSEATPTDTPAENGDGTPDGATPTAAPDDGTETPGDGEPGTAGPTPTTAPGTGTDDAPGTDAGGDTGDLPANAGQQHLEALREAGSFTVHSRITYSNETETLFRSNTTSRLDVEADRGYRNGSLQLQGPRPTLVQSTYTEENTTYQRVRALGQSRYTQESAPYQNLTPVTLSSVIGDVGENYTELGIRFDRVGSGTVDGVSVTRYEADSEDLAALWNASQYQNASVTDAAMTLAVGEDGIFRRYNISMTLDTGDGETIDLDVVQRFSDVGDTTVEEPDWLEEARAQTE